MQTTQYLEVPHIANTCSHLVGHVYLAMIDVNNFKYLSKSLEVIGLCESLYHRIMARDSYLVVLFQYRKTCLLPD